MLNNKCVQFNEKLIPMTDTRAG